MSGYAGMSGVRKCGFWLVSLVLLPVSLSVIVVRFLSVLFVDFVKWCCVLVEGKRDA